MKGAALFFGFLAAACASDVPDHDVAITSDCNGPVRSATFHISAFDFETSCSGGFLGECTTTTGQGVRRSGDLEAISLVLVGTEEFGAMRYELTLPPAGETADFDGMTNHDYVWCGWYVDETLKPTVEIRQSCAFNTDGCWAEIDVDL
jgi:hypothetical protein